MADPEVRILIVDDEESIRFTFEMFLKREGYTSMTTASTLEEALQAIELQRFDLVISDIVLQNCSGTELLKKIRLSGQNCPVVMITGFPNLDSAAEAVRFGAFDYIAKPVNKETLLRFVRQALMHWELEKKALHLQQENEKYRKYLEVVFSSVADAIVAVDDQFNIIQVNDTARRWFHGIADGSVINLRELSGPMGAACLGDATAVIREGKSVREHQVECHDEEKNKRLISLTASPLADDVEDLRGVVLVLRDITVGGTRDEDSRRRNRFHGFVGADRVMQSVYTLIENVGKVDTAVLITGESGTGKELAAEALHKESPRREQALVKVDCAAVPEDLLESELFGHRRGAFTGADRDRPGRLLQADQGTLFLDEIGDISPRMQLRLLRFLQEQTFTPVGQDSPVQVNVRVIAATNVDLLEKVRQGTFREDLYYRLKVVEIQLPPLRKRTDCIPLLISHFLRHYTEKLQRSISSISDQAMEHLTRYPWPGNVRELRHIIERACVMCSGSTIQLEHLPDEITASTIMSSEHLHAPMAETSGGVALLSEEEQLVQMLKLAGGNKAKAARLLGIDRSTLYRKLKRYKLEV